VNKKIILCIVLILLPIVIAQTDDQIFYSDELLLDLELSSEFEIIGNSNSKIEDLRANFNFFPEDYENQKILTFETDPDAEIIDESLLFVWPNPVLATYTYQLNSKIKTFNKIPGLSKKINFPLLIYDRGLDEYLQKTDKIDINSEIIMQASSLATGEDDLYTVVFNLAKWTKQNINYSLTTLTSEASQKASWVLDNRFGVCDELTNLFIAMCRSLGIPARFVSGVSYTNSELFTESWGLHGWAEVYFPGYGWVSYDPTYGQYGNIDAGHIKLKHSLDSDKSTTKFEWKGYNVELEPGKLDINVEVNEIGNKVLESVEMDAKPFFNEVSFGSYNLIEVNLKNKDNNYKAFEMILGKSKEVTIISNRSQAVMLKPNQEKKIYFIVKVDDELENNYIFTLPFEVFNTLGFSKKTSFKTSKNAIIYTKDQAFELLGNLASEEQKIYSKNIDFSCNGPTYVFTGEEFDFNCDVKNLGNTLLKDLKICLDDKCKIIELGINQEKIIQIKHSLDEVGETEIAIVAKNNDVHKISMVRLFNQDVPKISINDITHPDEIEFGPEFKISFELQKESFSKPQNVEISFIFNGAVTKWTLDELESNQKFSINLDKSLLAPSQNEFEIVVTYGDLNERSYETKNSKTIKTKSTGFGSSFMLQIYQLNRQIVILVENLFGLDLSS
jgi:transglutaminase-like putative cysteine protease